MADVSRRDEDAFHIHRALSHPVRKRILELLGDKGSMSFTDFKNVLDIRVGTLYYHFDILSRLISQDERKRYTLTPLGHKAYELSRSAEYAVSAHPSVPKGTRVAGTYLKNLFLPSSFFSYIYAKPKTGLLIALAMIAGGGWVSVQARLYSLLFFFDKAPQGQEALIPIELAGSWFAVFLISDLIARALFQRKGDDLSLFIGASFSFAPVLVFPLVIYLQLSLGAKSFLSTDPLAARTVLAVLQAWAITILSYAISIAKGLTIDKAVIIGLVVAYGNILLLFVLGRIT